MKEGAPVGFRPPPADRSQKGGCRQQGQQQRILIVNFVITLLPCDIRLTCKRMAASSQPPLEVLASFDVQQWLSQSSSSSSVQVSQPVALASWTKAPYQAGAGGGGSTRFTFGGAVPSSLPVPSAPTPAHSATPSNTTSAWRLLQTRALAACCHTCGPRACPSPSTPGGTTWRNPATTPASAWRQ